MSLMGIDIGTTGVKVLVFNEDGKILANGYEEYNLIFPKPGWVEFDTKKQWNTIFDVIKKVNLSPEVKKDPVTALAASTFSEGLTPLDTKGNIIHDTIYSTDSRSIKELEFILSKYSREELFKKTGYPPGFICPLNKILWIKNNYPDIFKKTKRILFTDDLLAYKLGIDKPSINYSLASRTLFFDINNKCWIENLLSDLDIDIDLFSKPCPSGIETGYIKKSIVEELGFVGKVSVVTGCQDQSCSAFGVGTFKEGITADGMGTVECIAVCMNEISTTKKMLDNNFSLQVHAIKDKYVTLAYNLSAGSIIKWFRNNLANGDISEIRSLADNLREGPSRLLVLPYFSASGTPYLDPIAKGSIVGLDLNTEKEDIFKGFIEGIVFEICFNIELLLKNGITVSELRVSGGGVKSEFELLLKASIIDKPILRMDIDEAGCLGAMILAGTGTDKFNLEEALYKFIKIKNIIAPDQKLREKYLQKFEQYKKMYNLISQIYD
jgi:xylulokinase